MPKTAPVPPHMQPAYPLRQAQSETRARAAFRYAVWLALIVVAVLCTTLWTAAQPWFLDHNFDAELRMLGYGLRARGMNCEVVIYGDSTALVGLDPDVIQRDTGLTACNVAEPKPVLDVVGVNFPLDQYLSHNRPPKFLLTAWAPGDFALEHPPMSTYQPEGYVYALQYDRGPWLWSGLIRHPKDTVAFLLWVQSAIVSDAYNKLHPRSFHQVDDRRLRDATNGVWHDPAQRPQTSCLPIPPYPWPSHEEFQAEVAEFRARYASRADHVLVDVAPIADCWAEGPYRIASVEGLYDNTAQAWPVSDFFSMNVHLTAQGSERFSVQIAGQIESILEQEHKTAGERAVVTR